MAVAALERLMLLLLAGFCLWLGRDHPGLLLALFFTCWSVMNAAVGANTPAYYKLIAKTIPADYRGRLYGIGGAISGAVGVPAATLLAGRFLTEGGFPAGYAACFLAAFVAQALTVLPLAFMREPAQAPEHHPEPSTPLRTAALIRSDPRLFWLCAAVALFSLNQMAGGFYTLYAVHRFQAGEQAIAGFTAVLMGARVLAFLLIGWLGDRHGNRAALLAGAAGGAASAGLALAAPELSWLYLVFAVNEVAAQALGVSGMNYVLELCPPERVSSYTAVYGLFTGPFRVGLPLAAGWLAATAGYTPLFVLAAAGALLTAVLLVTRVPEPRALPVNAGMEAA
jgi:MFS family permease